MRGYSLSPLCCTIKSAWQYLTKPKSWRVPFYLAVESQGYITEEENFSLTAVQVAVGSTEIHTVTHTFYRMLSVLL